MYRRLSKSGKHYSHRPCVFLGALLSTSVIHSCLDRVGKGHIYLSVSNKHFVFVKKEYLKSLGNSECSPQVFLENSGSLDKLLIIIKNEDIAAHVHKVR